MGTGVKGSWCIKGRDSGERETLQLTLVPRGPISTLPSQPLHNNNNNNMSSIIQSFEVRAVGRLSGRVDEIADRWSEMKDEEKTEWWGRVMCPLLVSVYSGSNLEIVG